MPESSKITPFTITTCSRDDALVLSVTGEVDIATVSALQAAVTEVVSDTSQPRVVLDLGAVTFMDSTGVKSVVSMDRQLRAQDRELLVLPGPSPVRRIFEVMGILDRPGFDGLAWR